MRWIETNPEAIDQDSTILSCTSILLDHLQSKNCLFNTSSVDVQVTYRCRTIIVLQHEEQKLNISWSQVWQDMDDLTHSCIVPECKLLGSGIGHHLLQVWDSATTIYTVHWVWYCCILVVAEPQIRIVAYTTLFLEHRCSGTLHYNIHIDVHHAHMATEPVLILTPISVWYNIYILPI